MDFPYYLILGFIAIIAIVLVYFWIYPCPVGPCSIVTLNPINNIVTGTAFTVSGNLTDPNGTPLSGKKISFITSLPGMDIPDAITGGITFTSPDGSEIQIDSCPMNYNGTNRIPDCAPDFERADDADGNKILRLTVGSTIDFPPSTKAVTLFIMKMDEDKFGVEVTTYGNTIFTAGSAGTVDGTANFHLVDKNGINQVKITSINDDPASKSTVGLAAVMTSDPRGDPVEQHKVDFENLNNSVPSPYTVDSGMFFSTGKAPSSFIFPYEVKANYVGDGANKPGSSKWGYFKTMASSRDLGVGSFYTPIADLDTGIAVTVNDCGATQDVDGDGICDTWETPMSSGGIGKVKFTAADGTRYYYDLSYQKDDGSGTWVTVDNGGISSRHKDVFLEADYMEGHDPRMWREVSNPVDRIKESNEKSTVDLVKAAFAAVPNNSDGMRILNPDGQPGINLHFIVDRQIDNITSDGHHKYRFTTDSLSNPTGPIVDAINVWGDPSSSPNNDPDDFDDIKARDFGTTADMAANTPQGRLIDSQPPGWLLAKAQVYHYFLFVHNIGSPSSPTTCGPSGQAEVKGNDGLVALGCGFGNILSDYDVRHGFDTTTVDNSYPEGTINQQAGTLLHELGHNLGLDHGGPREIWTGTAWQAVQTADYSMNCKPNYVSVMSYSRQMPGYLGSNSLTTTEWIDQLQIGSSSTLVETNLNEGTGVQYPVNPQSGTDTTSKTIIYRAGSSTANLKGSTYATSAIAINWNNIAPSDETGVRTDLNNFGIRSCGKDDLGLSRTDATETMTVNRDWYNWRPDFRTGLQSIDGARPIHFDPDKVVEITADTYHQMQLYSDQWYDDSHDKWIVKNGGSGQGPTLGNGTVNQTQPNINVNNSTPSP